MPSSSSAALPSGAKRRLCAGAAMACAMATILPGLLAGAGNLDWYEGLALPSFAPAAVVLAALWTVADILIGWAFHRVLCRPDWMPDRPAAIRFFLAQTGFAILWPIAFFALRSPVGGLVAILALLTAVILTGRLFGAVDRVAGICALVYGLLAGFSALLSLSIAIRN